MLWHGVGLRSVDLFWGMVGILTQVMLECCWQTSP